MTKKRVFIVEDDLAQQKLLQVHFEETLGDYQVQTFDDPEKMMASLDEKPYAIVLDHFFNDSKKTGLDYLVVIRKKYRDLPIIYHTTLDEDKVRNEVMKLGAEGYIIKDSASLVRLRTALDLLEEKVKKKGFFSRLFGK